jgi:hypothetical protein
MQGDEGCSSPAPEEKSHFWQKKKDGQIYETHEPKDEYRMLVAPARRFGMAHSLPSGIKVNGERAGTYLYASVWHGVNAYPQGH